MKTQFLYKHLPTVTWVRLGPHGSNVPRKTFMECRNQTYDWPIVCLDTKATVSNVDSTVSVLKVDIHYTTQTATVTTVTVQNATVQQEMQSRHT